MVSVGGGTADSGVDFGSVPTFTLTISETVKVSGTAANLTFSPAVLTLTDDPRDTAVLRLRSSRTQLAEADQGTAVITVSIINGVTFQRDQDIPVTLGGTAEPGQDFTFTSANGLTFTKPFQLRLRGGDMSATARLTAVNDAQHESMEAIVFSASHAGSAIASTQILTLTDDDQALQSLDLAFLALERPASSTGRAMYPPFHPAIRHYAAGCGDGKSWTLRAFARDPRARMSVNGVQTPAGTPPTRWGGLDDDDDIEITLSNRQGQSRTYVIHCLDADYPNITVTKRPGAWDGLILGAVPMGYQGRGTGERWSYLQILDTNGVPRYRRRINDASVLHFKRQPGATYPYGYTAAHETHGSLLVLLDADLNDAEVFDPTDYGAAANEGLDRHDFLLLPNGNLVFVTDAPGTADLSGFKDPDTNASYGVAEPVKHEILREVTADGDVVFRWSTEDHMEMADCTNLKFAGQDYSHFNHVEKVGADYLLSFKGCSRVIVVIISARRLRVWMSPRAMRGTDRTCRRMPATGRLRRTGVWFSGPQGRTRGASSW